MLMCWNIDGRTFQCLVILYDCHVPHPIMLTHTKNACIWRLYRCLTRDTLPSHVTFDAGIARKLSKHDDEGVDIGILKDILMVDYGALKLVVMRVSWVKHGNEGWSTIRKDCHDFWMAKLDCKDLGKHYNQYVFPKHVSQVFFMDDRRDPTWKVVLFHEPRSKRKTGEHNHTMFGASGQRQDTAGIFPMRHSHPDFLNCTAHLKTPLAEVPLPKINILDALRVSTQDDVFYDDDQYDDDYVVYDGPWNPCREMVFSSLCVYAVHRSCVCLLLAIKT